MEKLSLKLAIPSQHPCYADHFPGDPLVPGALLLKWILDLIKTTFPDTFISEVKQAKFFTPIRPGDQCVLDISFTNGNSIILVDCLRNRILACNCKFSAAKSTL